MIDATTVQMISWVVPSVAVVVAMRVTLNGAREDIKEIRQHTQRIEEKIDTHAVDLVVVRERVTRIEGRCVAFHNVDSPSKL